MPANEDGETDRMKRLQQIVIEHDDRLEDLEKGGEEGHDALRNQRRIVLYLRELRRYLSERNDEPPPDLPEFERLV